MYSPSRKMNVVTSGHIIVKNLHQRKRPFPLHFLQNRKQYRPRIIIECNVDITWPASRERLKAMDYDIGNLPPGKTSRNLVQNRSGRLAVFPALS